MSANRIIFDTVRPWIDASGFTPARIAALDAACVAFAQAVEPEPEPALAPADSITVQVFLELAQHEAIVREWYRDSEGVGTWAMGVTNASGHNVDGYKNNPQPVEKCIEVSLWLLRTKYLPQVLNAFAGHTLREHELAAALSWHWNTGAILRSDWVGMFRRGDRAGAKAFLLSHYLNGGALLERRKAEVALLFDARWANDGKTTFYEVSKPSYSPKWSSAKRVDISAEVRAAIQGAGNAG